MMDKYPLVMVDWKDAQSDSEWGDIDSVTDWTKEDCIIHEVGWLIKKTRKYIVITNQICADGGIGNRTKIPSGWVKNLEKLFATDEKELK